jgi:hypothetical protein
MMEHTIWLLIFSSTVSFALGRMFARNRDTENYNAASLAYKNLCDAKDVVIQCLKDDVFAQKELCESLRTLSDANDRLIECQKVEILALKELNQSQLELDEAQKNLIKILSERDTGGSS